MRYLIAGPAKSDTTRRFSQLNEALGQSSDNLSTYFEPDTDQVLESVLSQTGSTLAELESGGPIGVFKRLHAIQHEYEARFKPFMLCSEDLL